MADLADHSDFRALLRRDTRENFTYIDPPFNFNHRDIAKYPPEVTGLLLLNSFCRRVGWNSLSGRRLLDFGCGVRFARTIVNLAMDIDLYAGVDVNKEAISWLQSKITDPRSIQCIGRAAQVRSMWTLCNDPSPTSTRPACFQSSHIRHPRNPV